MDKRELRLTNADIAELINNLSDDDFYEVMRLIGQEAANKGSKWGITVGQWIDKVMEEIEQNRIGFFK